jgi:hypothetical protein
LPQKKIIISKACVIYLGTKFLGEERHRIRTNGEQSWKRPRLTVDSIGSTKEEEEGTTFLLA